MGTSQSAEMPKSGYHVLQVQPSSPGEKAGLVAFFDFIVAAQGIPMTREDSPFVEILKTNVGKEVKLVVYSTKTEQTREAVLVPSDSWGGAGLAGISIRFCPFEHATEQVWHVLDVYPDSPASAAGLEARTDYIVGTPDLLLSDSEDFFTLIGSNEGKSIPLYVYSTNTDNIRLAHITPNSRWGGTGSIGADIGFGFLHRIPMNRNIPAQPQSPHAVPGRPAPSFQQLPHGQAQQVVHSQLPAAQVPMGLPPMSQPMAVGQVPFQQPMVVPGGQFQPQQYVSAVIPPQAFAPPVTHQQSPPSPQIPHLHNIPSNHIDNFQDITAALHQQQHQYPPTHPPSSDTGAHQ